MKGSRILGVASAVLFILLTLFALVAVRRFLRERFVDDGLAASPATPSSVAAEADRTVPAYQGFLYGRVTTDGGITYEGRLRFGGDQEAFWSDYFNGIKVQNRWAALVPPEQLPMERHTIDFLGLKIADRKVPRDLGRMFMARFGDLARIESIGREVRVTLKSSAVAVLDLFERSDFDDGVRVWDRTRGVVDVGPRQIRSIDFAATEPFSDAPGRLHGTVRTQKGEFTGFVQWNRQAGALTDDLVGRTAEGKIRLRFDGLRSIARQDGKHGIATLADGREIVLRGTGDGSPGNLGVYVDDARYGRVLVPWDAFERLDLSAEAPRGSGTAYGDYPPGRPLTATVTTRSGRILAGRLVFDLDESETIETLDAPMHGVDYTLPFALVASVDLVTGEGGATAARVTLRGGEVLALEMSGDLGEGNAGLLVFVDGRERVEYLPWGDVARIEFDARPPG
jgi:hypothetical protein